MKKKTKMFTTFNVDYYEGRWISALFQKYCYKAYLVEYWHV